MKVAAISYADWAGGAARAASRLHQGVRALGVDARLLVKKKTGDDPFVIVPDTSAAKAYSLLQYRLDQLPLRLYPRRKNLPWSTALPPSRLLGQIERLQPDIVHLHWINAGFMSIYEIGQISRPVVWTLHDMWPMTGGCHYAEACAGYQGRCGACPQLGSRGKVDLSRLILSRKKKHWSGWKPCLVTPSHWLADQARASALFADARVEVIPNGIDTRRFSPVDKRMARQLLGLPLDGQLVLFVAVSATSNPWKGYAHLQAAIANLAASGEKLELAVLGASSPVVPPQLGLPVHFLGSLSDEIALSLVYGAADVLLAPSTEDNLPNTVMESMSCGVPVVAFRIGGIPDMVEHERNGYLARPVDAIDLANGIRYVLGDAARYARLAAAARESVVRRFDMPLIARRYLDLYEDMKHADI